jgi:hypothetical protein
MKTINIDERNVWVVDTKHSDFEHEIAYGWSHADFEQEFNIQLPDDIVSLNYEPERDLYHLAIGNLNNVESFKSTNDHPFFQWLEGRKDDLFTEAIKKANPNYKFDGKKWKIPKAKQDEIKLKMDRHKRREQAESLEPYAAHFAAIIWKIGKDKGLWTDDDIPEDLK